MSNLIKETKNNLLEFIDNLNINTGNYDLYLNIYKNTDEFLFTKIMEEIQNGNIQANDFSRLFAETSFLEESIDKQRELFRENKLLKDLTGATSLNNLITGYKDASIIEKENILSQLASSPEGNELEQLYKANLLNKLLTETNSDTVDEMMLSLDEYIVPVDYEHIVLSDYDREFARKNDLTEDEMKKIKSFAAWTSTFFEE